MANSVLPSLSVVADASLPALRIRAPFFAAFASDLSPAVANAGEGVKVSYMSRTTASLWAGTFAPGDTTVSYATVTFIEPFYRSVGFSPNEIASYSEQSLADKVVIPMINDVLDEATKKINSAVGQVSGIVTATSLSASGFTFAALQNGFKTLDISGSSAGNFALLDVTSDYSLQNDLVNNYGASAAVINGTLQSGYTAGKGKVYQDYLLPNTALSNYGYVCSPDAVAFASRVPAPLNGENQQLITDPQTGLTVALSEWDDLTLGKHIIAVKLQFAAAAGRPGMAVKFVAP